MGAKPTKPIEPEMTMPPPEQMMMIAVGVVVATTILLLLRRLAGSLSKSIEAVCELGPAGKPCGAVANSTTPTPASRLSQATDRSPLRQGSIKQFVPEIANRVSGTVKLKQQGTLTTIEYRVQGLTPGDHGFHINETADFSHGCVSAGPIYNPFNKKHGGPNDSDRMVGDLGNITADNTGVAKGVIQSNLVKLTGPYKVVGRSFMVHQDPDDLGKGDNSEADKFPPKNGKCSKVTGNAGARLAAGEIKLV